VTGDEAARRTRTLARIAGPFLAIAAVTIFARYDTLPLLVPAYMQNAPLVLATGVLTLMVGLTMIAMHHHFTSVAAVFLTMMGIAVCARGLVLMLAPDAAAVLASIAIQPPVALIVGAVVLLLGLWLTFVGWLAGPRQNS
jgi:hypothetical protein